MFFQTFLKAKLSEQIPAVFLCKICLWEGAKIKGGARRSQEERLSSSPPSFLLTDFFSSASSEKEYGELDPETRISVLPDPQGGSLCRSLTLGGVGRGRGPRIQDNGVRLPMIPARITYFG